MWRMLQFDSRWLASEIAVSRRIGRVLRRRSWIGSSVDGLGGRSRVRRRSQPGGPIVRLNTVTPAMAGIGESKIDQYQSPHSTTTRNLHYYEKGYESRNNNNGESNPSTPFKPRTIAVGIFIVALNATDQDSHFGQLVGICWQQK